MSKIDVVRAAMVEAMKAKDKERKDSLSMLLSALKNAQIDKREAPLTEDEENAIVKKEIKQVKETIETAPADRADIIDEAKKRLAVYQEFAPADMTEDQIRETIAKVLAELGIEAPTAKDKERKDSLSMLLSALKNAQIDKREAPLTEDEENAIVKKEIKQVKETIDTAPADRADIIEEAKKRLAVYQEFAPADMTEDQIRETIAKVLAELGIEAPTAKDKGKIMKSLMPLVKGKADGKIVNEILAGFMK